MKRVLCCFFVLVIAVFAGCSAKKADFFDVFRGGYVAQVEGELYGVAFSASLEMGEQGEGAFAPATITFYAPKELSGTTVVRNDRGRVTVKSGGLVAADMGGVGAALFSLFPTAGAVERTEVTEEGHTRLLVAGTQIEFLSDGTPYSVKAEHVSVTVVTWNVKK